MNWIKLDGTVYYKLIKPGTLVKDKSGEIRLIGNLNVQCGYCDCCSAYEEIEFICNDYVDAINKLIESAYP